MQLPYLELPLAIGYGTQPDENHPDKIVTVKLLPAHIAAYHEGYFAEVGTFVYHGPHVFQVAMSVDALEAQLTGYWNMLTKQEQSIKQKLKIIN